MYCFCALGLLNVIFVQLIGSKPVGVRSRLLAVANSPEHSGDLGNVEEEAPFDFEAFLEHLKADFLRNLNLSEIPSQEKVKEEPPQFMIDLYNRYTKDKTSSPIANVVRSFSPEDIASAETDPFEKHILLFNVSIPWHEEVTRAELQVHTACQGETACFSHLQGNVVISVSPGGDLWEEPGDVQPFLVSKEIHECGWLVFDMSGTVKRWVKEEKTRTTGQLQITVESRVQRDPTCGKPHISVTPESNHLPLLIVFSNDHGNRIKEDRKELQEMMEHEQGNMLKNNTNALRVGTIHHASPRTKRSIESNHCRRTSLRVNFKEIGWNWIIAPPDYEAFECKGGCFFPLTDNVTPTKHAIIQTLVHYKNPKKAAKACCVPTKLEAISLLYNDDAGTPTLKYQYEGMKVAECGCR